MDTFIANYWPLLLLIDENIQAMGESLAV